jgi:hypothetical protein
MQVYAIVNCATDEPRWVSCKDFVNYFDQADLHNRDVLSVQSAYLEDWFHEADDGRRFFFIPVAGILHGRTDLIGTRHRLAVLLPHLTELPIAFAKGHLEAHSIEILDAIPSRRLDTSQPFWIPDLPICKTLPSG